jgi:hypothetical protein
VLDVSAGVVATPDVVHEGLTRWIGGVKLASDHDAGREVIELRTTLTQAETTGVFGIELGPRIERRLRRGAVVFLDGKAEARAFMQSTGSLGPAFFTAEHIQPVQYGIASQLVRFLVARDRRKFDQFLRGIKEGMTPEESLEAAYQGSLADLIAAFGQSLGVPQLKP